MTIFFECQDCHWRGPVPFYDLADPDSYDTIHIVIQCPVPSCRGEVLVTHVEQAPMVLALREVIRS